MNPIHALPGQLQFRLRELDMRGGDVAAIDGGIPGPKQGWLAMWSWRPSQQFHINFPCCKINLPCSGLC